MNGHTSPVGNLVRRAGGFDNIAMGSHEVTMHYALWNRKCQMHSESSYAKSMSSPSERLRIARMRAGYETAGDAADALGIPRPTYLAHENGSRGYPAKKAQKYGKKFKVDMQWLMFGTGEEPGSPEAARAELARIAKSVPEDRVEQAMTILRTFIRA